MMELTDFERAVLQKLLDGNHRHLTKLRAQLPVCRVNRREMTGVGFFSELDVQDARPADNLNVRFGDVTAEIEGLKNGAGFVLFVEHGRLVTLEGFSYDEPWPSTIGTYRLDYDTGSDRDWRALNAELQGKHD